MKRQRPLHKIVGRLGNAALAVALALALLLAAIGFLHSGRPLLAAEVTPRLYLPSVLRPAYNPAGSYECLEYEFGLVWDWEVITLTADGASLYAYRWQTAPLTGTWRYTSATQEVQFTNFRWPTATYLAPDRLWASRYLPEPDFEIALSCTRR